MSDVKEIQLKQQLKDLIAGREVKAAVFYTFNFSPRFFENYVMPLLVPAQRFITNEIANHIVWRNLYKEKRVPPITVYFDQDAKDTDSGPMLDYEFIAVRIPAVGRNKGNFHPKNSFILVESENGEEELIVLTGSNNITQNGWCENLECVAQIVLNHSTYYPAGLCKSLREFMQSVAGIFAKNRFSQAEERIFKALNRNNATNQYAPVFYHSLAGYARFIDFLQEQVLDRYEIRLVEIQSPYFSNDPALVDQLHELGMQVHIEAPLREGVVWMEQNVFEKYAQQGVTWTYPDRDRRNTHRKVYRLHAADRIFTVIGSVNFTQPAWRGYTEKPKEIFNIESALLFEQRVSTPAYLLGKPLCKDQYRFEQPAVVEESRYERETVPDIRFEIDWTARKLTWNSKAEHPCTLQLPGERVEMQTGKGQFVFSESRHGDAQLEALSRKPLLNVDEQRRERTITHLYYMAQTGFGQRPSHVHITPSDMIDAWEILGKDDEMAREWFETTLEHLADLMQDESGRIDSRRIETKSLLNDMARHFYGLARLEEFLFDEKHLKGSEKARNRHFQKINYYLSHDNIDTLVNYMRGLEKLHAEGILMHSYTWLLFQIVRVRFYNHPKLKLFIRTCAPTGNVEDKSFKHVVEQRINHLDELLQRIEQKLEVAPKLLQWTLKNLQNTYEHA